MAAGAHVLRMRALRLHGYGGPEVMRLDEVAGLRVPIERRFPLADGARGYELSRGGHARGKIVLQA
jgi:hypothetical protein